MFLVIDIDEDQNIKLQSFSSWMVLHHKRVWPNVDMMTTFIDELNFTCVYVFFGLKILKHYSDIL
jgi:hypothetical protein